ncbi:MAG: sigma-70 family RNA polymerase sigma factor [Gemmatimonadaceae bacterium]|nr:sigma-70 family RNA polymerase sigma factor [Gemmatimonadaceae bacterium]
MTEHRADEVTQLLNAAGAGEPGALDRVLPLVYQELRQLAEGYFRSERPDHTLQTTALVHEAYLRLVDAQNLKWENRRHFFGIAAQAMRQILVDHARQRGALKRGAGRLVTLDAEAEALAATADDIIGVDDALHQLAALSPRAARVVELRYFAGLSIEQTAETLEVSVATVKRDWVSARAWLQRELGG